MNLPSVPQRGAVVALETIVAMEAEVTRALATITDVETLQEWRAQAAALEVYLRGKEFNGPMLGAQRRVEARIGQLLGDARDAQCREGGALPSLVKGVSHQDRNRFRVPARGLDRGLPDEDWRRARDPLIAIIQQRYPAPRHQTTFVQANGKVKKPRADRIEEIRKLSDRGMRAIQIAQELGLQETVVRKVAREEGITLPDAAIGKARP